jgi:putative hydrolase of the HAD superfamily
MTPPYNNQFLESTTVPNPHINAILFDWGGVFTAPRRATSSTRRLEENLNIPEGRLSSKLYDNEYWMKAQIGEITDGEFWRCTLRQFDIFDEQGVAEFKKKLFRGESNRLRTGMIELVRQLKQYYTVVLLTNADDVFRPLLKNKFHVDRLFDHVIISAEVGIAKPDPGIFRKACNIVKVRPGECVFIDDSLANIQGARDVGLYTIQYLNSPYKKTAALKKDLRRLGLSVYTLSVL